MSSVKSEGGMWIPVKPVFRQTVQLQRCARRDGVADGEGAEEAARRHARDARGDVNTI